MLKIYHIMNRGSALNLHLGNKIKIKGGRKEKNKTD